MELCAKEGESVFGYVRIDKPELKVREYEAYKGAYCGLCRSMGKCTGCMSRMTLSYDFTFLLIFRTVLTETETVAVRARCPVHPFRKQPMLARNEESEYVSCAAALLSYYKCKDDLADETGKRKLRARFFRPTAARMRKKVLKRYPKLAELDMRIADAMNRIAEEEKNAVPSADLYAALSGDLLGEIFAFGLSKEKERIARTVGRHVGKWIYLTDAYDDLPEDREKGRFNPYLLLWGREENAERNDDRREMIRIALLNELAEAEKAMDLLDFYGYPDFAGVLRNILYRGMPRTAEAVLAGKNINKTDKVSDQRTDQTDGKKGNV